MYIHTYNLQDSFARKSKKKQDARYLGQSKGCAKTPLDGCGEEATENSDVEVNIPTSSGTLQTPQAITKLHRLGIQRQQL